MNRHEPSSSARRGLALDLRQLFGSDAGVNGVGRGAQAGTRLNFG